MAFFSLAYKGEKKNGKINGGQQHWIFKLFWHFANVPRVILNPRLCIIRLSQIRAARETNLSYGPVSRIRLLFQISRFEFDTDVSTRSSWRLKCTKKLSWGIFNAKHDRIKLSTQKTVFADSQSEEIKSTTRSFTKIGWITFQSDWLPHPRLAWLGDKRYTYVVENATQYSELLGFRGTKRRYKDVVTGFQQIRSCQIICTPSLTILLL